MKTNLKITPVCDWLANAKRPLIVAGPCSAESEEQMLTTAKGIAAINKNIIFRAGIWKPRTRPNSFEGLGNTALPWMKKVKKETGLLTATEVANAQHVESCLENKIDILWIGARTTVNPFSVQEIANALQGTDIPVFVKNPVTPDLQIWIGAIERLNKAGITKIVAVHRGFHSHESSPFRNNPMWEIAIQLRTACSNLPIICDPSHICGNSQLLSYVSQKALNMDMHGLMIETHCQPSIALSDAKQQITPAGLNLMLKNLVYRKANSKDETFKNIIEQLRDEINVIDEKLLTVLMERMNLSAKIGNYKKSNNVTVLQTERWNSMLSDRLKTANSMGLSNNFAKNIFQLIHQESINKQLELFNQTAINNLEKTVK